MIGFFIGERGPPRWRSACLKKLSRTFQTLLLLLNTRSYQTQALTSLALSLVGRRHSPWKGKALPPLACTFTLILYERLGYQLKNHLLVRSQNPNKQLKPLGYMPLVTIYLPSAWVFCLSVYRCMTFLQNSRPGHEWDGPSIGMHR